MRITVALFCLLVAGSASAQEEHVPPGSRPDAEVRNASSVADTSNIAAGTSNLWSRYLEAERWAASSDRRSHRTAAQEYLDVLRLLSEQSLTEDLRPDIVSRLVTRIVEPLLWIGALSEEDLGPEGLPHDVWPLLEHWWRQTDPMPATVLNERLIEHLRRVAFAAETYADAQGSVDDRGKLYVRLGRPSHRTKVDFTSIETGSTRRLSEAGRNRTLTPGRTITQIDPSLPRFPDNEVWLYRDLGRDAQYVFIRRQYGYFDLGSAHELIPSELRRQDRARDQLKAMQWMYKDLALYAPAQYSMTYQRISNYVDQLELLEFAHDEDRAARINAYFSNLSPRHFARDAYVRARAEDQQFARQRAEAVPSAHSNVLDPFEVFPVAVRVARFLNPDGETRIEGAWAFDPGELPPSERIQRALAQRGVEPSGEYAIDFTLLEEDARTLRPLRRQRTPYRVSLPDPIPSSAASEVRTFQGRRYTSPIQLALQWDVFWAYPNAETVVDERSQQLKVGAYRTVALRPLSADVSQLEMSDMLPMRLHEDGSTTAYPFGGLTRSTPLALAFELYHLNFDADDRTTYRLTYRIRRPGETGNQTELSTTSSGRSRTTDALIALDLSEWDEAGDIEIEMTVEDLTTGQVRSRQIQFTLVEE